jgi:hypothetical protein
MDKKKTLVNYTGLLGIAAFLSYIAAMVFSPSAYPGYDWMSQAVSDLSAANAPSRDRWGMLAAVYNSFTLPCLFAVCIYVRGKLNKPLRVGVYLFTVMSCISKVGSGMFPLSDSGNAGKFQDIIKRRLRRGQAFAQPYLGCRECTAHFGLWENGGIPAIAESRDLGWMLYDMDYSRPDDITPMFFRARMENGVVDVSNCEVVR